jgi:hypothetical protein
VNFKSTRSLVPLGVVVAIAALLAVAIQVGIAKARAELEEYAAERRMGAPLKLQAPTRQRLQADRVLSTSTALDVEVGTFTLIGGRFWVCFEGHVATPRGEAPLAAIVYKGDVFPVSQVGCKCVLDEFNRRIDCL